METIVMSSAQRKTDSMRAAVMSSNGSAVGKSDVSIRDS